MRSRRTSKDACAELDKPHVLDSGKLMTTFNVWISSKGDVCRVRVDGLKNTLWLLERLSRSFVFKTSESLREDSVSSSFSFSVIHNFQMTQSRFERLLASIPEVRLTRVAAPTHV